MVKNFKVSWIHRSLHMKINRWWIFIRHVLLLHFLLGTFIHAAFMYVGYIYNKKPYSHILSTLYFFSESFRGYDHQQSYSCMHMWSTNLNFAKQHWTSSIAILLHRWIHCRGQVIDKYRCMWFLDSVLICIPECLHSIKKVLLNKSILLCMHVYV